MKKLSVVLLFICFVVTSGIQANAAKGDTLVHEVHKKYGEFLIFDNSDVNDSERERVLVTYTIKDDKLTKPKIKTHQAKYQKMAKDKKTHNKLWKQFANMIPKKNRQEITQFQVFTDGHDELLAYVLPLNYSISNWALAVDYKDSIANKNMYYSTLVHEYGHILMYKQKQWNRMFSPFCSNYVSLGKCSNKNSRANQFYEEFWAGDLEKDWKTMRIDGEVDYEFYDLYEADFVTFYAMTDPDEDFAETFEYFLFTKEPTKTKKGKYKNLADAKLGFFFEDPQMLKLREKMLKNLLKHY